MKKAKVLNNESGFFKFIIVMLVLACIVYVGIKVGVPYYKYSALNSDAKEIARITVAHSLNRAHMQVYERAQELKIQLNEDDIEVKETGTGVRIGVAWSETVDFLGIYQHTFHFIVDVEE
jgi:hypothetical protein